MGQASSDSTPRLVAICAFVQTGIRSPRWADGSEKGSSSGQTTPLAVQRGEQLLWKGKRALPLERTRWAEREDRQVGAQGPACTSTQALGIGHARGGLPLTRLWTAPLGHHRPGSLTCSLETRSVPTIALCFSLWLCRGSHFLLGPRYGPKEPTNKTLFGLLQRVSEAALRAEGGVSMPPPQPSLPCGPRTAEAPAFEPEGCLLQNIFAKLPSSQPRGLSLTFQEAGPPPALCPGHPVLILMILNSLLPLCSSDGLKVYLGRVGVCYGHRTAWMLRKCLWSE